VATGKPHRQVDVERRRPSVFWALGAIVVPIVGLLAKIEVVDAEKLPDRGAFVLAPNHHSEFDPLIVAVAVWRLGRAPRFMAKESLFGVPVLGWALRATGMIPVARSSSATSARQTLETSALLVEHGRGVVVYPEGSLTRDPDLWPMRGKTGAVRLAIADDIPLIPVAQWGAQEILPRYGKLSLWPLRKRMVVRFGDPVDLSEFRGAGTQPAVLTKATAVLMDRITDLLALVRGIPAPTERWNPSEHGQKETGRLES
jgi:1-acyl-sn-glycerol-3-phosphate acyltransferase